MASPADKLMSLAEAVEACVSDGDSVAMGLALESNVPFAVGHSMIRAGLKDLTLIGPISDVLFDQLIGGGLVRRIRAAWVGNVAAGQGYNFRRAVESGRVEMIDYSNYAMSVALTAAAQGLPFGLTTSLLGGDIGRDNPDITPIDCPFTGRKVNAVKALRPDVAVVHVQRADVRGNAQLWGHLGIAPEAVRAARRTIVVCEQMVETDLIRSDPNRTVFPGFLVTAVVHQPRGAHPSGVQGCYGHDDAFYMDYATTTRDPADAVRWQREWIDDTGDWDGYLAKLGRERLERLKVNRPAPSRPVDYGY